MAEFFTTNPISAAFLFTTAGFFGFLINFWILFKVIWQNVFGRSFGWIWVSRGVAYCISSLILCCFIGPGFALFPEAIAGQLGTVVSHIALIMSTLAVLSNLLIAANRCLLISIPFTYKDVFSEKKTLLFIAVTWFLATARAVLPVLIPDCENKTEVVVFYRPTFDCFFIFHFSFFIAIIAAIIITVVADIYAICKLQKMSKVRHTLMSSQTENEVLQRANEKQLMMCYMIIAQSILNPLTLISTSFGFAIPNDLLRFLSTFYLWALVHSLDGLVIIFFTANMRTFNSFQPLSVHS